MEKIAETTEQDVAIRLGCIEIRSDYLYEYLYFKFIRIILKFKFIRINVWSEAPIIQMAVKRCQVFLLPSLSSRYQIIDLEF